MLGLIGERVVGIVSPARPEMREVHSHPPEPKQLMAACGPLIPNMSTVSRSRESVCRKFLSCPQNKQINCHLAFFCRIIDQYTFETVRESSS
jgi:hypothetical protein